MAGTRKVLKKRIHKKPKQRFAIVVSRFNEEVTGGLLAGAIEYLGENGISQKNEDIFYAPGAFEIPLIAKKLVLTRRYSGVICLGCVIKGDTAHFEFISLGATMGIQQVSLETQTPVAFGILTTYDSTQATRRSGKNVDNKGREAAAACLETAELLASLK